MQGARPVGRFPPTQRVRTHADHESVKEVARRVTTPSLVLLLRSRALEGEARLGIVATRRLGCAPVRNRAKRLVREAFRSTRELWSQGMDLVVIVRRPPTGASLDSVVAELRDARPAIERATRRAAADLVARSGKAVAAP